MCFVFLLVMFMHFEVALAQDTVKNESVYPSISSYLLSFPGQTIHALRMPARFSSADWTLVAVSGLSFGFILLNDEALFHKLNGPVSSEDRKILPWTNALGNGLVAIPALAALYLYGEKKTDHLAKDAALAGLQVFILSAGAVVAVKHLTHRARPDQLAEPYHWSGPFHNFQHESFPSGHTMRAFAVATVLSGYYPEKPGLGLALYGLAGLTAIGRLKSGEHWPSDVFAGAILGYALGRSVLHFNRRLSSQIQIHADGNTLGMIIRLK